MAVLGAGGGIGQPLSLLMKLSPHVGELSLYDVANTAGVAADLSHISTGARVKGFSGPQQLGEALEGCHLVLIPAGGWGPGARVLGFTIQMVIDKQKGYQPPGAHPRRWAGLRV